MLEPKNNPNPRHYVDPPAFVRHAIKRIFDSEINEKKLKKRRDKIERKRRKHGRPHVVEYFHQLDDPYSHLMAQAIGAFSERYDVQIKVHFIRASGGKNQPEATRLAKWAHQDASLTAPYLGLCFSKDFPITPAADQMAMAFVALSALPNGEFLRDAPKFSQSMWRGELPGVPSEADLADMKACLDKGSARLAELGHYSGAMLYYGGEWYWGVDRLFFLENRLRDLGACSDPTMPLICPRPEIDVGVVDASNLELDFYPSLNSPYTSIIYDKTLEIAGQCKVRLNHKPVLPMIMRGIPATREKGRYIAYDTKREGTFLGVPFGPVMMPIGEPVRQIYSLFPWAREKGKETDLLSAALNLAFAKGVGLHRKKGLKAAVELAGLSWTEAKAYLGTDTWKAEVESHQNEMADELDLWGVPSYRLKGGGEEDLCVWGQDRLWLIAAEIRKRAGSGKPKV